MRMIHVAGCCLGLVTFAVPVAAQEAAEATKPTYPPLDLLLSQGTSILGQQVVYPDGTAKITAALVTMVPGQETGWHHHEVPLFAQILDGELTVDYGTAGKKVYKPGDVFVEAFKTRHNGKNTGTSDLRLLAVFAGADGVPNTVADDGAPTN